MSTDDSVSELAMGYDTILWLVIEPGTKDFDESATL